MNPKLVDIHCHLDFKDFDNDREGVIKRALGENIWIINIGIDAKTSQKAIEIAEKYEGVFACVGLHPGENLEIQFPSGNWISKLRELAKHPKVVAIGECGIDKKSRNTNLEAQKDLFIQQIELAKELDKPLMIHCREAHDEVIEILKQFKHYGNIHFFAGTQKQAEQYFDLGFTISFTGVITYESTYDVDSSIDIVSRLRNEVIKNVPLDKIMIETDAPFVAPVPYRGQRCEPLYVMEIAKKIAEIRSEPYEKIAEITTANAQKLFNLKT